MSFKVVRKGQSLEAIIKNVDSMKDEYVAVGLFSKGAGADYDNNLAMRMAHFEKGSAKAHLPSRPVFKTTMNDRKSEVKKEMSDLWGDLVAGKLSKKEAYNKLGNIYEKMLKAQFTRRKFAPLSPNYKIRPSGRRVTPGSIPLLDTHRMQRAITHKVVL